MRPCSPIALLSARISIFLALLIICGCSTPPSGAPTELDEGFRREGHPALSAEERKAVAVAKRRIEQTCGRKIDAYYRVERTTDGYLVSASEVHRYEKKQPKFTIGRDWFVDVKDDGTVTRIVHSAM